MSKKIKKPIKPRKLEKNNRKNRTVKKPIKILKKPAGSVRFYKQKNKPNRTQTEKNRKKTEPNRFEPVFVLKNQTEPKSVGLNRFRFKKNKFGLVIFL